MLTAATTKSCVHCREEAGSQPVVWEDKTFCCEGCKTVYEILNQNELCTFYDLDQNAAFTLKGKPVRDYSYLDDAATIAQLVNYQDDHLTRVSFYLPQIHCASCIWLLEHLYKINADIVQSKVNFLKKEIDITFNTAATSLKTVVSTLDTLGYAPAINLQSLEGHAAQPKDKTLLYQLGIAGFCFGNVMLLSFPEYLGLDAGTDPQFSRFFGYLNIALALPVLLYSAKDYLASAARGVQYRAFNLDMPIALGVVSLFGRSAYEIITHTGAGYMDSFTGLIFFLLVGKWVQQRVYHHLSFERDYKSYFPLAATVKREGKTSSLPIRQLEVGDTLVIRHQELIPADGILKKGKAAIDYSFVTGESEPVEKSVGDQLFAGGRQQEGSIEMILTQKTDQSYLIRLWDHDVFHKKKGGDTARIAGLAGKIFTIAILLIALTTLAYWLNADSSKAVNAFTAVLIIACPCAVALSIPFTMGNIARIMARNKLYLRNTNTVENLAALDHIVFDKTGTLTEGIRQNVQFSGNPLNSNEQQMVFSLVNQSSHPKSRLLAKIYTHQEMLPVNGFQEHSGKGISGLVNESEIHIGSAEFIAEATGLIPENHGGLNLAFDGILKGHFLISEEFREGMQNVLTDLSQNYPLSLLSGDNDREAARFKAIFPGREQLHFFQSPENKLDFIKKLQGSDGKVMMVGDGLNDAGALQQSDVGMVISDDTNNFSPACDAILDAGCFDKLPALIGLSKAGIRIIYLAFLLSLIYNIVGLSFAVQALLSPVIAAILMPLSSISVVLFGTIAGNMVARKNGLLNR